MAWKLHSLPSPIQQFMGNYGLHAFGVIAFTVLLGLIASSASEFKQRLLPGTYVFLWIGATVASTFNELAQYLEPDRVVDSWDVFAQVVGSTVGIVLIWLLQPRLKEKKQ